MIVLVDEHEDAIERLVVVPGERFIDRETMGDMLFYATPTAGPTPPTGRSRTRAGPLRQHADRLPAWLTTPFTQPGYPARHDPDDAISVVCGERLGTANGLFHLILAVPLHRVTQFELRLILYK